MKQDKERSREEQEKKSDSADNKRHKEKLDESQVNNGLDRGFVFYEE